MSELDHFPMSQWVDWARGVATVEEVGAVEEHLRVGCVPCRRRAEALLRVINEAAIERLASPPQEAVDAAQALFSTAEIRARAG